MMGLGVLSRLVAGSVADRLGGLTTLAIISTLQAVATFPYILLDDLAADDGHEHHATGQSAALALSAIITRSFDAAGKRSR
jgi:nitrate/nitrite transporter NarK